MKMFAPALAALAFATLPLAALAQQPPNVGSTILSSQSVITGTLEQPLSSKSAQINDQVVLDIVPPFPGDDQRTFNGARIIGHVVNVQHANPTHAGKIDLAYDRLQLADGTIAQISGETVSIDAKKGGNTAGRAIAGAIVGQIVGNYIGKHIGTDVGGAVGIIGGGIAGASLGTNVTVAQGSFVKMRTTSSVVVTGRRQASGYQSPANGYATPPAGSYATPYPYPH